MARPKQAVKRTAGPSKSTPTLHKFFSAPSVASKPGKTKKNQTSLKRHTSEVIIIDDDDEPAPLPSEKSLGKRKAEEMQGSSDIEVVESTSTPSVKRRATSPLFGQPTLFLSSPAAAAASKLPKYLPSSPTAEDRAPSPYFGKPILLSSSPPPDESLECVEPSNPAPPAEDPIEDPIIDIEDEWGTGDDEQIPGDDDEVTIVDDEVTIIGDERGTPFKKDLNLPTPTTPGGSKVDAFSMLMASRTDNEAWIEADTASPRKGPKVKTSNGRSKAPFYKVLQGMPIAVDAFKYGAIPNVTAYFLTHAHSDHYTNLSSSWKNGPIYCSEGTANLIMHMLKVDKKWVKPLPMDIPIEIPNTNGVKVTLIEANHCPGSSLFFFEGKQTVHAGDSEFKSIFIGSDKVYRYLHCGDFRASPQHVLHPCVKGKKIDHVYLDTTYLDPKYSFPPQPQVISACAELAKHISDGTNTNTKSPMNGWLKSTPTGPSSSSGPSKKMKRTLMIVGTYSIGKERIVKAIAKALKSKVYCNAQKTAILKCQTDPELHAMLTNKPLEAQVHVVPLNSVISDVLKEYVKKYQEHFDNAVAFRPTGWTFSPPAGTETMPTVNAIIAKASRGSTFSWRDLKPGTRGGTSSLQIYGVPYSEHSSFVELTCFAMSLQWGKMIATVNVGDAKRRDAMGKWFDKWEEGRKKNDKEHIVPYRDSEYW